MLDFPVRWLVRALPLLAFLALFAQAPAASASSVCASAFPSARSTTTKSGVTRHNRQDSVQMVVCGDFGHGDPKVKFKLDNAMKCALVSQAIGAARFHRTALAIDGACTAGALVADPGIVSVLGAACSFVSKLLDKAQAKLASFLAGIGCAAAPPAGHWLGTKLEIRHENQIAVDVVRHGKCIEYNRRPGIHSPWSAAACASSDRGFSTLQRPRPRPPQLGGGVPAGTSPVPSSPVPVPSAGGATGPSPIDCSSAPPSNTNTGDAAVIIAGQSVANVSIDDDQNRVRAQLGQPSQTTIDPVGRVEWIYSSGPVAGVAFRCGLVALVYTVSTTMKTERGIGPGSTLSGLVAAYPEVTCSQGPGSYVCTLTSTLNGRWVQTVFPFRANSPGEVLGEVAIQG